MRVLVACEYSGRVRDAFRALGHDAMSCDLLPTDVPGPHYQGSVLDVINDGWDLMIAHPPCTFISKAGVRWLHSDPTRWAKLDESCEFFNALLDCDIPKYCIENPIPHRYAIERLKGRKYTQIVHPWQHGHGETKATCLWLKGLPNLTPTNIVDGREQRMLKLPPSPDRWKIRSTTYHGIAHAMAQQWGGAA
jgi:hypothetical protein